METPCEPHKPECGATASAQTPNADSGDHDDIEVIYEKGGVFIHSGGLHKDCDTVVAGKILVNKNRNTVFVEWLPYESTECSTEHPKAEPDWTKVTAVGYNSQNGDKSAEVEIKVSPKKRKKLKFCFDIKDLKCYKMSKKTEGWEHITFIMKDGTTRPSLHFHAGGCYDFVEVLKQHVNIIRSRRDKHLYLVKELEVGALQKSFNELNLFKETSSDLITKFYADPYATTMTGFSKVRNFLWESLVAEPTQARPKEELAEILTDPDYMFIPGLTFNKDEDEPEFESNLPPRKTVERSEPLTSEEWSQHIDSEGRITNVDELQEKIFRGGVSPSLRGEVWKFLLGYFEFDSTSKERSAIRKKKLDDYFRMKHQWKTISADQESRFFEFSSRKNLIEKDVERTDRTHPFYQGEDNDNIKLLYDILMTYCMYNFDLGYVQGMSDLLAPILVVLENEVDAFWCFVGFMEKVKRNFDLDQEGMKLQLLNLSTLLHFVDNQLFTYLESKDSGNLYFCFRWLLILFKREFNFDEIMRCWEVFWTSKPCENFHLLMVLAVLDYAKNTIIENEFGFTEILKHINDMSGMIELEPNLCKAEAIYNQIRDCTDKPKKICDIIGLASASAKRVSSSPNKPQQDGDDIEVLYYEK